MDKNKHKAIEDRLNERGYYRIVERYQKLDYNIDLYYKIAIVIISLLVIPYSLYNYPRSFDYLISHPISEILELVGPVIYINAYVVILMLVVIAFIQYRRIFKARKIHKQTYQEFGIIQPDFDITNIQSNDAYNEKRLRQITIQKTKPAYITPKPLGGFKREHQNEIFLIGTVLHQLYISDPSQHLSKQQENDALNINMLFFITLYPPNRTKKEYFDYVEKFKERNNNISHLSISETLDRSIEILSTCDSKQIVKLRKLFQALRVRYEEINNKKSMLMSSFATMLDNKLAKLSTEVNSNASEHYDEWIG